MPIALISALNDYDHPPVDPVYQVGERVKDLLYDYGVGTIDRVEDAYEDRGGTRVSRPYYKVDWQPEDGDGSSMRFGWQLDPVSLLDHLRIAIDTLKAKDKKPLRIKLTQAAQDRLINELGAFGGLYLMTHSAHERHICGIPLEIAALPNNAQYQLVMCDHRWITYATGYGVARQYCKLCGAEQQVTVTVPKLSFKTTYNRALDLLEMTATALYETIITPIRDRGVTEQDIKAIMMGITDDLPYDKPKFVSHHAPLNRRLCLNIRVAKWLGFHHFHLSSTGQLWGFRDVKDGDRGTDTSGNMSIVDVGDHQETMIRLPDYAGDLIAAWGIAASMSERDAMRFGIVLHASMHISMYHAHPADLARHICRVFVHWRTGNKNDTLDRG